MSLIRADARWIPLQDGCVQCVMTSPPYWGLRDYGTATWDGGDPGCEHNARSGDLRFTYPISEKQRSNAGSAGAAGSAGETCLNCGATRIDRQLGLEPTPDAYVANLVQVFAEVWRVLKDDGTLWLNLGDSYATGAGAVGNCPGGGQQGDRWKGRPQVPQTKNPKANLPLGPVTQPNRMPIAGLKPKDLVGIPWCVAFALQADGWYLRSDIIWAKPNPMPESVMDRPTKSHEYVFLLTKSERYYYDADAIAELSLTGDLRRPYTSEGAWQLDGRPAEQRHGGELRSPRPFGAKNPAGRAFASDSMLTERRNARSVWTIPTQPYPDAHFATFPEELPRRCILAGSRPGDLIFDPFIGSGTVGAVAEQLGRRWVGTDLAYQHLSKARTIQRGLRLA